MAATAPTLALNDGRRIPQIGYGCWQLSDAQAPDLVGQALHAGYRLIDTAAAYGNEGASGAASGTRGSPARRFSSPRSSGTTARAGTRHAAPSTRACGSSVSHMSTCT